MDNWLRQNLSAIISKVISQKIAILTTGIPATIATLALKGQTYLAIYMQPHPELLAVQLLIGLVLSLFFSASIYLWFKSDIVFLENEGCWFDKKSRIRYCASCKAKTNQLVPMKKDKIRWRCAVVECSSAHDIEEADLNPNIDNFKHWFDFFSK